MKWNVQTPTKENYVFTDFETALQFLRLARTHYLGHDGMQDPTGTFRLDGLPGDAEDAPPNHHQEGEG